MENQKSFLSVIVPLFCFVLLISCDKSEKEYKSWEVYNGGKDAMKYSSLTQIDTGNVSQLQVAWTYHTGDADSSGSQIQCNPIMVEGVLYGVGPQMTLFAVNAMTGKAKWVFDPYSKAATDMNPMSQHIMINSRGVAYWTDGKHNKRIFFTAGSYTYAIDAHTGKPIPSFGINGSIDLHEGLDRDVKDLFVVNTSPGIIYKNLIILGTRVDEAPPSAPGHIRAFDVITGKLKWIFHTIPQPGEPGYETWEDKDAWKHMGGANTWSGFSLDEKRGIVFAPTGSAAYDFYGGKRKGANLYANCLLALDAATGKLIWHFQLVHHDLWDKDLPSPPALITVTKDGKQIDAVAQTTKNGMVYVFERETGKPIFDIVETPVDTTTDLKGEKVWPTQPIPQKPAPFVRQHLTNDDINPYLSDSLKELLTNNLKSFRHDHMYTPPGKTPSIIFPGFDGGGEWGGPAFDPQTGILYVNANEMPWIMEMRENKTEQPKKESWLQAGERPYKQHCSTCHGFDRKGTGNNPTLINIQSKYKKDEFLTLVNSGRRMMPAFQHISDNDKHAIASFVLDLKQDQKKEFSGGEVKFDSANFMPYKMTGYTKFLSPEGYPAISPPWGTLNAINLNTGEFVWKTTLGEYAELKAKGIPPTGTENYGGPVVTAGGLVFIGASRDGKLRAFNKANGKLLWEYILPAPAFATPAVYELNGKQYLVIACGGGKLGTKSGDAYIAFVLPE
jgi:quinoprotein glucose dehydrogenase